jgi:Rieske Fe-S protein
VTTESRTTPTLDAPEGAVARACACLSRRHALSGAAVVGVGVPFLAACGAGEASTATDSPSTPASSAAGTTAPSDPATSAEGTPAASGLTTTADIPVGGGKIFADEEVVIVQPTEGEFLAWSNICTHQGCAVSSVEDGVIVCNCHNSTFSIEDGSPQSGPASSPLDEIALTVDGDSISLA